MTSKPGHKQRKAGFLPIETNWFDRLFISVVIWVALSLLWMRFLEPLGLSVWIAVALSVVIGAYIIWRG
ncbi:MULTISPECIES: DUF2160 family membrane protein [unclassified Sinorhizobium]|uniref:DUF2160 family membrane protein n=1 Tax=unclassified Sinorhizobium TaxID=2613772 RepID=UPI003526BFF0